MGIPDGTPRWPRPMSPIPGGSDVWEVEREPDVIYLYEAYKDRAAFEDHHKKHA